MQIKFKINIGRSTFNHASVAIQEALFLSFVPWHQTRKPYMQWKAKKSIKHVSRIHWRMSVRLGECVGDPNLWYTAVSAGTSIYCDLLCRDVLGKFVTSRHISQMTQRIQAALEVGIDLAVMFQSHRRIKLLRFSAPLHWGRLAQLQHLHQSKQQVLTIHWNILEYIGITPPSLCKPPKLGSPARCERQKIAAAQIFETLCLHAILQMSKNNQLLIRFRGFLKWGGTLFHPFWSDFDRIFHCKPSSIIQLLGYHGVPISGNHHLVQISSDLSWWSCQQLSKSGGHLNAGSC